MPNAQSGTASNQARKTIEDVQIHAQRIYARTDQRITNMEMRHSHKLDQMIRIIEREGAAALRQEAGAAP